MVLNILMVDDNELICQRVRDLIHGRIVNKARISFQYVANFDEGLKVIKLKDIDLIILDLFKGKPSSANRERPGEQILEAIKKYDFIPVIFFTGLVGPLAGMETDIVRVVRKGDGTEKLFDEIKNIMRTRLPLVKQKLKEYIRESLRSYFWDFIHPNWQEFKNVRDDVSLGYLLVRRLANSMTKDNVIKLLEDPTIDHHKVHPVEFYIHPPTNAMPQTGDILLKGKKYYIILTPSCFIEQRKADNILLGECVLLKEFPEYKKFVKGKTDKNANKLKLLIESRRGERYYFLPGTPFIDNMIIDFQKILHVDIAEIRKYKKITKLDDPFAQSMLAFFIRYYNRVGTDDLDSEYIMKNIEKLN